MATANATDTMARTTCTALKAKPCPAVWSPRMLRIRVTQTKTVHNAAVRRIRASVRLTSSPYSPQGRLQLADEPGDPAPRQVVHEHPGPAVDGGRAERGQGGLVAGARVALVEVEVVRRVVLGLGPHEPVARHLGQDRGGGDRQAGGVAPDDPGDLARADEVPAAVDQDDVGGHAQALDRPAGGQLLGRRHAQLVALLLAGVADRPRRAPG